MLNEKEILIDRMLAVFDSAYLFYAGNPELRGTAPNGGCYYQTTDGKKRCSVGRCMRPAVLKEKGGMTGSVEELVNEQEDEGQPRSIDPLLLPRYRGLPMMFWATMQNWHDDDRRWYPQAKWDVNKKAPIHGPVNLDNVYEDYTILREQIVKGVFCTRT